MLLARVAQLLFCASVCLCPAVARGASWNSVVPVGRHGAAESVALESSLSKSLSRSKTLLKTVSAKTLFSSLSETQRPSLPFLSSARSLLKRVSSRVNPETMLAKESADGVFTIWQAACYRNQERHATDFAQIVADLASCNKVRGIVQCLRDKRSEIFECVRKMCFGEGSNADPYAYSRWAIGQSNIGDLISVNINEAVDTAALQLQSLTNFERKAIDLLETLQRALAEDLVSKRDGTRSKTMTVSSSASTASLMRQVAQHVPAMEIAGVDGAAAPRRVCGLRRLYANWRARARRF